MRMLRFLAPALLFLASTVAQAGTITFVIETELDDASNAGTFEGFITFDAADVFAFNSVSAADFIDWGFSWGSESVAAGGAGGFTNAINTITFDAAAEITTWAICVTTPPGCGAGQDPGFFSNGTGALNFATADGTGEFNNGIEQSWTRQVPEPGTLALMGLGLVAVGVRRRLAG